MTAGSKLSTCAACCAFPSKCTPKSSAGALMKNYLSARFTDMLFWNCWGDRMIYLSATVANKSMQECGPAWSTELTSKGVSRRGHVRVPRLCSWWLQRSLLEIQNTICALHSPQDMSCHIPVLFIKLPNLIGILHEEPDLWFTDINLL